MVYLYNSLEYLVALAIYLHIYLVLLQINAARLLVVGDIICFSFCDVSLVLIRLFSAQHSDIHHFE